ncbi:cyclodehydratase [Mycolicibacterium sp. S2-37]|uniref:cyclodehydratase n=1 Tax=Mycolicibacterium sp. S2-37 TaxID=2810297 RepID=UPI001A952F28|nr:cyclodehydratase [Mycolicibacterium sp. S2-37]MBO0677609.1 cyclodehydratase [Mycolicibacterium sp. S2-37]
MPGYLLNPTLPVLLRPDGAVQVGWDPRRAVLVEPPAGLTASALADMLRGMQSGATVDELAARADTPALADLLASLIEAGVVTTDRPRAHRTPSVRIHGRGPLSDLLVAGLRCSGARVGHSRAPKASAPPEATDLVILADYLIAEPRLLRELHSAGVPHLAVRTRDGSGLVGPLVLPGRSSCLACADLHRSDRDAAWPAVAAQLRGTVGNADRATVLATVALALDQVERILRTIRESGTVAGRDEPLPVVDTTFEFDVATRTTTVRRWSHHPRCDCWM